ncbi:MAG: hypothetical protein CMF69_04135 [Magnetovibrio sp.]|nr:hypothetical protein [Magnetovibrio sp.]|tara:strand:+ start:176 stop:742 length:567 start_codon:yes stop_codon:yes gene_type:complete
MSDVVKRLIASITSCTDKETSPAVIVEQVKRIALNLAKDTSWVRPEYYEIDKEQGMGITVLNREGEGSAFVEVISWMPGLGIEPHDHQTWGVVLGINGIETNIGWQRLDDGSRPGHAKLTKVSETNIGKGEAVHFLPDDIHSVFNNGDGPSLSSHIYGRDLANVERSEFDPINKLERPCPKRIRKSHD